MYEMCVGYTDLICICSRVCIVYVNERVWMWIIGWLTQQSKHTFMRRPKRMCVFHSFVSFYFVLFWYFDSISESSFSIHSNEHSKYVFEWYKTCSKIIVCCDHCDKTRIFFSLFALHFFLVSSFLFFFFLSSSWS